MDYYVLASSYYLAESVKKIGYLHIQDGHFRGWSEACPSKATILDVRPYSLAPGYVDSHIHGYAGADIMDANNEGLQVISRSLLRLGVTSYLPTSLTAPIDNIEEVCRSVAHYAKHPVQGAKVQGLFLEGPFFSEAYAGAQNPAHMMDPDIRLVETWQEAAGGLIKKLAFAPERKGGLDFASQLLELGIIPAIAHTACTYDQAQAAVQAGARIFVHTFNRMSGLHHRQPGAAGAALLVDQAFAEIIADGHHLHPKIVELITKVRGVDHCLLVSDSMRAGGLEDGRYNLGDYPVDLEDGQARMISTGDLAGSVLSLDQAVRNMVNWGIATPHEAINMASLNPARSLGLEDRCGQIRPGLPADFIVLDDKLYVQAVYLDGEKIELNKE